MSELALVSNTKSGKPSPVIKVTLAWSIVAETEHLLAPDGLPGVSPSATSAVTLLGTLWSSAPTLSPIVVVENKRDGADGDEEVSTGLL